MMQTIATFAALSMAGTIVLSLLPEGGIKRTAAMAVGLVTLMCWAEGIAGLFGLDIEIRLPATPLAATSVSLSRAEAEAASTLLSGGEESP